MQSSSHLEKNLSLLSLLIFGVGIIIGAGVYAVLGAAGGIAGNSLWLSFLFAAIVAILTAFSYCELSTLYPTAGAEYIYARKAYPKYKLPSFLLGFVLVLAGAATAATVSLAFGGYFEQYINLPKPVTALLLLTAMTIINSIGITSSNKTNLIFTLLEVLGLFIVIWFGFTNDAFPKIDLKLSAGTFSASSLIFFVYLGFEDIANLAEETREPNKNIPRAILYSLLITTLLYIAVAIAVMNLVTPEVLANSDLPLADAIKSVAPGWVNAMSAIALFATANTTLITLLAIGRMVYGIAREGDLPLFLSKTTGKSKTPVSANVLTFVCAASFLLLGELEILANVSSLAALLGFLAVNFLLIVLRYREKNLKRPFKSPISIKNFPVLAGAGLLSILALCTQFELKVYLIMLATLLLGSLVFILTKRFR